MARPPGLAPRPGHRSRSDECCGGPFRAFPPPVRSGTPARVRHHPRLPLLLSVRLHGRGLRRPYHRGRVSRDNNSSSTVERPTREVVRDVRQPVGHDNGGQGKQKWKKGTRSKELPFPPPLFCWGLYNGRGVLLSRLWRCFCYDGSGPKSSKASNEVIQLGKSDYFSLPLVFFSFFVMGRSIRV